MPGVTESRSSCRVMLVPTVDLEGAGGKKKKEEEEDSLRVIKLKHPRTSLPAVFLLNQKENRLLELLSFAEDHRSWFIGERVVSDGRLVISTPVDPTFLILPYLMSAEKLVPLDHLLTDQHFPEVDVLVSLSSGLDAVAEQRGDPDLCVWQYSEARCLDWLTARVEAVQRVLALQRVDLSEGATALAYRRDSSAPPQPVEYRRYAFGIVSQYLAPELAELLRARLDLPQPEKPQAKKAVEASVSSQSSKKRKLVSEEPEEDYTKDAKKVPGKQAEKNAKQKALAKSAEGTKNIMAFFQKK